MKLSDGIKIEITKECDDCKLCNITEHPEYLTRCKLGLDVAIGYLSYAPGPNCPGPITMHLIPAAVAESHDRERELMLEVVEAAKINKKLLTRLVNHIDKKHELKRGDREAWAEWFDELEMLGNFLSSVPEKLAEAIAAWEAAQ